MQMTIPKWLATPINNDGKLPVIAASPSQPPATACQTHIGKWFLITTKSDP
ncbi:MAG: hypothetical protein ACRECP_02115 [Methylocella sp.]